MKGKREHRVPLSTAVIEVLNELAATRRGEFLLPGYSADRHASHAILDHVLYRLAKNIDAFGSLLIFAVITAAERPRILATAPTALMMGASGKWESTMSQHPVFCRGERRFPFRFDVPRPLTTKGPCYVARQKNDPQATRH
jgi:hypothetical protein